MSMSCSICTAACTAPEVPSRPPLCPSCDETVRKQVRRVLTNRLRQQRYQERRRLRLRVEQRVTAGRTRVLHHAGRDGLEDWQEALPKAKEIDPATIPPPPQPRLHNGSLPRTSSKKKARPDVRYCTRCEERPLNLGRYKTTGDICGTCKKELKEEERQKSREEKPLFAKDQDDLQRQLSDETPLPDDDDEEGWAKLLAAG